MTTLLIISFAMIMNEKKKVLITPLDWGLGHATRIVPVVEKLLELNTQVLLAADNRPYDFLKSRFPDIEIIRFPGYKPKYPNNSMMATSLLFALPKMWYQSRKARRYLQKIVDDYRVNLIISDNRYECYSKGVYNIFISHQIQIQTRGLQNIFKPIINKINHHFIKKYDELWIPDFKDPDENLSGTLSHIAKYPIMNYHFIGSLSRFSPVNQEVNKNKIELLVILSGPEPQRSLLEKRLEEQINKLDLSATMVLGKPEEKKDFKKNNIHYVSHADDDLFSSLIQSANVIVSRPGYSTIMDLSVFGKKAIFIPTPGQTEQEYLAGLMKQKGYCFAEKQQTFDLKSALSLNKEYTGLPKMNPADKITTLLENLLIKE